MAGLVAGLHEGLSLADTARRALAFAAAKLAFAAAKLAREGASLPPRPEVEAIAATVQVEALA